MASSPPVQDSCPLVSLQTVRDSQSEPELGLVASDKNNDVTATAVDVMTTLDSKHILCRSASAPRPHLSCLTDHHRVDHHFLSYRTNELCWTAHIHVISAHSANLRDFTSQCAVLMRVKAG